MAIHNGDRLAAAEYRGELLCPRCGVSPRGSYFEACWMPNVKHAESCALYEYSDNLCDECEAWL